jgi:uncharacterized protein (TIGR02145 family)
MMLSIRSTVVVVAMAVVGSYPADATQGSQQAIEEGMLVDPRDGTAYRTVRLGSQLWLGENIRYEQEGSWLYGEDFVNLRVHGRLYDWQGAGCACPPGWHLPTAREWEILFEYLGGSAVAGGCLKEAGTEHWKSPNTAATNSSGFAGRPSGGRRPGEGTFHGLGMFGAFWSSTEQSQAAAWAFFLGYHYAEVSVRESTSKRFGFSVRCVHD